MKKQKIRPRRSPSVLLRRVFLIIRELRIHPGRSTAFLAGRCGLSKATMERYLAVLSEEKLARSVADRVHSQRRLWKVTL